MICGLSSLLFPYMLIGGLWSSNCKLYELQTVNCKLWTVNCELQTANCELWTANCELWTVNCKLQTVNCKLWTVNCELQTVVPKILEKENMNFYSPMASAKWPVVSHLGMFTPLPWVCFCHLVVWLWWWLWWWWENGCLWRAACAARLEDNKQQHIKYKIVAYVIALIV